MDFRGFSNLIMIEQTLFALPFALIGVLFAGGGKPLTWVLVIIALAAARTAGMSFNRVIDAEIDAKNPRTEDRALPQGELSPSAVWLTAAAACLIFVLAAALLNPLCFYLSFIAVFLLVTYSFLKRFSASSHFYLGLIEAAAPIGGYIAVTGEIDPLAVILGLVIMAWITGLDIIYAFQDIEFDTRENLHSLPVALGEKRSLAISRLCYAVALGSLVTAGLITQKNGPYWIAIVTIGGVFLFQQTVAESSHPVAGARKIFRANLLIAPVLFLGVLIDLWLA